jgi:hypothetical protein
MLPNVFVAGAQKSGTTTLCALLDLHPNVVLSSPKEPVFFSRSANLTHRERYEACFHRKDGATPQAIIDGSNAYMADAQAVVRIKKTLGDELRFVFCLREPAARAISGYWHQAKKGRDRRSLADALCFDSATAQEAEQEEESRLRRAVARGLVDLSDSIPRFDDPLWHFRYFRGSFYLTDLERFIAAFGEARVKMILTDDLVVDARSALTEIAHFLGLNPAGFPDDLTVHRNPTLLERASGLQRIARKLPGRRLLHSLPGYAVMRQKLLFREPPGADPQTLDRLRGLLQREVERLQVLLNRNLLGLWGYGQPETRVAGSFKAMATRGQVG